MALERIPSGAFVSVLFNFVVDVCLVVCCSEIRAHGGVSRMTDPKLIKQIKAAVCLFSLVVLVRLA